jgi:predicted transcriptional regulator
LGKGEEQIQRVMDANLLKTGDGFTAHDVSRMLKVKSNYAAALLKEMFDRKLLTRRFGKTAGGRGYIYQEYKSRNLMRTDFRVDHSVYEMVEEMGRGW